MEENTLNQEQTATTSSNDDEGYFDDVDMNDIEITPDDNVASETDSTTTDDSNEEQAVEAPFMNVRYNKEDVGLTQEQAIEYAQKGMNYDKVIEKYNGLNSNLERLANANGLSVDEYLDRLEETQFNFEVNQEMEQLKEQYPDTNEEALMELAQSRVAQRNGENLRQAQVQQQEQLRAQDEAIGEDITELIELYPQLTIEDIKTLPKEIWQAMDSNGKSLVYNYGIWRNKQAEINKPQIEAKQRAQQLNVQNQQRNIGSTTNVNNSGKVDDFMAGWNED